MSGRAPEGQSGPRFGRARAGLSKVFGYSVSMVLLAIASLVAIPAMVTASGAAAWGAIAAGQSIGGVAAVVIAYGWGLSGPAVIARADTAGRLKEYVESVACKLVLCVPIGGAAFAIAWLIGGDYASFAGIGALSMASVGLTANWYFVGRSQPYLLLLLETMPRVVGTCVGILLMNAGSSAWVGVQCQLFGMLGAFLASSVWILRPWHAQALRSIRRRPVLGVLVSQRNGVTSTVVGSLYSSTPIIIVSVVAPGALPVYAVVDKVQRQVIVALTPFVTVLQGWVPRATGRGLDRRVMQGLLAAVAGAVAVAGLMFAVAPELVNWLGGGQVHPTTATFALMAVITGVSLIESVTSKACLAALTKLDVVARATAFATVVGLPLVAVGAGFWGAQGALTGMLTGLVLRLVLELVGVRRAMGRPAEDPREVVTVDPEL